MIFLWTLALKQFGETPDLVRHLQNSNAISAPAEQIDEKSTNLSDHRAVDVGRPSRVRSSGKADDDAGHAYQGEDGDQHAARSSQPHLAGRNGIGFDRDQIADTHIAQLETSRAQGRGLLLSLALAVTAAWCIVTGRRFLTIAGCAALIFSVLYVAIIGVSIVRDRPSFERVVRQEPASVHHR